MHSHLSFRCATIVNIFDVSSSLCFQVCFSALLAVASAQYFGGYGYAAPYAGYGYSGYAAPYAGYAGYAAPYAGYSGYAGYGYAAPYSYASTYHSQDELGQAAYGHQQIDQGHSAVRDAYGNVAGGYSYISPEGKPITVRYTAGVNGFQVESNALPVAPVDTGVAPVYAGVAPVAPVYTGVAPEPVDFTPEVKAATAEHLAAVEEAKGRSKRSLPLAYAAGHFGAYAGLPFTYSGAYTGLPLAYSGAHARLPLAYSANYATAYAGAAGYPAELTETILNPGHATAYRVDPIA